jgi:Acetyltransferase (GNAT) family
VTITYARESLGSALTEIKETLPAMWAEMAEGFGEERAEPNWAMYFAAEAKNCAFLLTAREDGVLVGYFGMLVYPNLSLKNELAASATPYYVVPRRDRGLILRSLIRHAITICQRAGVKKAVVKTHPWASAEPVLVHLGAREVAKDFMFDLTPAVRDMKEAG